MACHEPGLAGIKSARQQPAGPAFLQRAVSAAGTGPMVSFTFDDVPEKRGHRRRTDSRGVRCARNVLYRRRPGRSDGSGHWTGVSADEIVGLHRRGHEIACHTFSHARGNRPRCGGDDAGDGEEPPLSPGARSLDQDREFRLSLRLRDRCRASGSSARPSVHPAAFFPASTAAPWICSILRSTPLIETDIDRDGIDRAFDEAVASNGWLIFYSHDVEAAPSPYGCSPAHAAPCAGGGVAPENPDPERRAGAWARGRISVFRSAEAHGLDRSSQASDRPPPARPS